jgi:hypothetical protein
MSGRRPLGPRETFEPSVASPRLLSGLTIAGRDDALDFMDAYPGYGGQRWYSVALATEQVSFSWRRMPPGTRRARQLRPPPSRTGGGLLRDRGHVTFKVGDDVFQAGPQTAVRMTGEEGYSVHDDTAAEAELLIFSMRLADAPFEKVHGFWP